MPIRSFCRSSGRTVSHVVFSTLLSFTLFRVLSALTRLLSLFLSFSISVCCRFLDSLVFVVASVFDRHTHTHSLSLSHLLSLSSLAHTHTYTLPLSLIHSFILSLTLSFFYSFCSRFIETFASLLTLNSILSEGSSSILFNHQNDLWDFYTQKTHLKLS